MPVTTAALAVALGTPTTLASAAGDPPADLGYAVEDGLYPDRANVLALTGADLIEGDGNITVTPCDGPYQIKVWAVKLKTGDSRICFAAPGRTGYLKVNIPRAYRIETEGRDVKAGVSISGTTEELTIARDTSMGFGEADLSDPKQAVLLQLRVTGASTPPGVSADITGLSFSGRLNIGDIKHCSATLIDPQWVLSAKSCFTDQPFESNTLLAGPPKDKTTVALGRPAINLMGGHASDIVELVPHPDHDLVMGRLATPATNIAPAVLSTTGPVAGQKLTVPAFGRTQTEWVPTSRHDGAFTTGTVEASGFSLTPQNPNETTVCQGDAGAPAVRQVDYRTFALVGIVSRSTFANCLGSSIETLGGAHSTRVDDLHSWFQFVRAQSTGWKTQALVQSGSGLYQATRLNDASWTGFQDVQNKASSLNGIRASSATGMNGDTHVVAISNNAGLYHTIRKQDGTWSPFGNVFDVAGELGNLTSVTTAGIGFDLHILAVADGKAFHAVRKQDGNWTRFRDISNGRTNITAAAMTAVSGELQTGIVSNGKLYHSVRKANDTWTAWGDVSGQANQASPIGPITSVSAATGSDEAHFVIATDNGTRQYHTIRSANGSWAPFGDLKSVLGTVSAKSVAATHVNGEVQVAVTTSDNKLLHTIRHTDRTWDTPVPVALQGLPAGPGQLTMTATWNG
ncbi:trypsin-like serine protease [Streptomyces sp. NPDC056529]|uniref:trypsin-like serine protease n=1 Tax=Streptomyces sp. NPDC056529 TaxID=3345855 RepID=UPI0036A003B6